MSTRRLLITTLTLMLVAPAAADVQACWLTDWLHGHAAPVYMADSSASAGGGYTAGYAPVMTSSYAAGYATTGRRAAALPLASRRAAGAGYALQRPAYRDNPSVYTGQPTLQSSRRIAVGSSAYAGGAVPLSGSLRGSAATSSSFYGTGNLYPDTASVSSVPASGYASARPGLAAATPNNAAAFYAPPRRGGLARFFSSLLGTDYRSSYYRAPVTYYRPATTVDPVTGSTVTVQRPCTSSVQQLQRTPYRSLQPASPSRSVTPAPSSSPAPSAGCRGGTIQPLNSYGTAGSSPSASITPRSGVRPAGGYDDGNRAAPIPSTGQSYPAPSTSPNTAPLTGSPPRSGNGTDDRAPVDQPQLNSSQRPSASVRREITQPSDTRHETERDSGSRSGQSYRRTIRDEASETSSGQSRGEDGGNSNSSSFRYDRQPVRDNALASDTPPSLGGAGRQPDHRSVRPIPAPTGYRSPFQSARDSAEQRQRSSEPAPPSTDPARRRSPLAAPPLPATRPSEPAQPAYQRSPNRTAVPVREAALQRRAANVPSSRSGAEGTWDDSQRERSTDRWRDTGASSRQRHTTSRPRVTTDSTAWYSLDP